ncbi:hypothetical protein EDD36DRAFT_24908 [Exophiala viscosa]|uniref:Uncharacterized protein n=1 Tax=Exophiala viscosa TaxID=2486360 RepID=A0AAN6IIB8_9EURO|nr:hypothetical protein EDD36DRAFT_24908 [Exophiala viscosa]
MPNTNAVDHFNRRRSVHLTTEDRQKFYFLRRSILSRRQTSSVPAPVPSTTTAVDLPPGLPHSIFGKETKHHNDNSNGNGNGNGDGNGNGNNNDSDDDSSDDGNMEDHSNNNNNPFARSTTTQAHGNGQMSSMNIMAASTSLPESTVTLTISPSSATLLLTSTSTSTSTTIPLDSATITSTISFRPTSVTSTAFAANTMLTFSSTSSQTTTTDAPSAESTVTPAPSVQVHKASISAPTIAAAVVASLVGALAVFAFGYLLFRYCTPLKGKVLAYRGRRGQRLPGEEDGGPIGRDNAPDMSEVNYSSEAGATVGATTLRQSVVRQSVVRQSTAARTSAVNNAAPDYPADLANVPFQREKNQDPEDHPFSNQVPLAASEVGGNHIPSLRQSIIVGLVMGSTIGSISDSRPPTYMTHASETDPVSTIINEYAGPSRSASTSSASFGIHPMGLSANPPTPVISRNSARSGLETASPRQLSVTASSFLMPSTPTPAYFSAPTPPASVIGLSPSTNHVRASVTPSESASNAPSSPLPLPPRLPLNASLPNVPALSRFSWNSSSIAVGSRNRMSSAQRFATSGAGASPHAVGVPSISAPPPLPPLTLPSPLAVRRSSAASSIMSAGNDRRASLRDMTS